MTKHKYSQRTDIISIGLPTLSINNNLICSSLRKSIQRQCYRQSWNNWWEKQQHKQNLQTHNIDWNLIRIAFKSLPDYKKIWAMKHSHGTCGVGYWLVRWKQTTSSKCPRCGEVNESALHVWKCKKATVWNRVMELWKTWLRKYNCPSQDILIFIQEWANWKYANGDQDMTLASNTLRNAILDQRRIGWDNLSRGYLSNDWSHWLSSWHSTNYDAHPSSFLKMIWNGGRDLWQDRNDEAHEGGKQVSKQKEKEIASIIRREYSNFNVLQRGEVSQSFSKPITTILQSSRNAKRKWVGTLQSVQARQRRRLGIEVGNEVRDEFVRERNLIHQWRGIGNKTQTGEKEESNTK